MAVVVGLPSPDPVIATCRKLIVSLVLVDQMTLSSAQTLALEHKLGTHRLIGNTKKTQRHF